MSWREANSKDIFNIVNMIRESADHYKDKKEESLVKAIKRKKGKLYYYNDGENEIAMCFLYKFSRDVWRLKHCSYRGNNPEECARIWYKKAKEELQKEGYNSFEVRVARNKEQYEPINRRMIEYFRDYVADGIKIRSYKGVEGWNIQW